MGILGKVNRALWRASTVGQRTGAHVTRFAMYGELGRLGAGLSKRTGSALSISHSERLLDVIGFTPEPLVSANYPEANMLALPFGSDVFDIVVSDQVLEHIEGDPQLAVNESLRVVRPGGLVLHTTCFINPVHGHPSDFWRFTPDALRLLHRDADVIAVGGWGNFLAWPAMLSGLRYVPIPHAKWHPLNWLATRNDPDWPIVTWVLARKRLTP